MTYSMETMTLTNLFSFDWKQGNEENVRIEDIRKRTKVRDVIGGIAKLMWSWVGPVIRHGDRRSTKNIVLLRSRLHKQIFGRAPALWLDDKKEKLYKTKLTPAISEKTRLNSRGVLYPGGDAKELFKEKIFDINITNY